MVEQSTVMLKVCAWCGKNLGTVDGKGLTGTTHGICSKCMRKELRRSQK